MGTLSSWVCSAVIAVGMFFVLLEVVLLGALGVAVVAYHAALVVGSVCRWCVDVGASLSYPVARWWDAKR